MDKAQIKTAKEIFKEYAFFSSTDKDGLCEITREDAERMLDEYAAQVKTILPPNKEDDAKVLLEAVLLDISIDIQNELLRQCKRAKCDDYQTGLINENTIAVFNLNKQKYITRLIESIILLLTKK